MWLLAAEIKKVMESAQANGCVPTAEQQASYEARFNTASEGDNPRILNIAGDVAQINVSGVITKSPSFMAMLFGGGNVTYPEIVAAFASAEQNPEVSRIEMRVDSGGGHFEGLFDAIGAMQSTTKPIKAVVSNLAASAAYALVSQADEITAVNKAARFGSIGVVATFSTDASEVQITSTNAPNKRPDVNTPEGVAAVREELDAMHDLFVETIASGRSTTTDKINAEYGQGATMLADAALKRGMIDSIAGAPLRIVKSKTTTAAASGTTPEIGPMKNVQELKASHPDVYMAAVQDGIEQERERVSAHLNLGQGSGLIDDAVKACVSGDKVDMAVQTKHVMAAANRGNIAAREGDDSGNTNPGSPDSSNVNASTDEAIILAAVEASCGIGQE